MPVIALGSAWPVTTAAQIGLQDSLIKILDHWQSSAYALYIKTPREVLCGVAKELVKDNASKGSRISSEHRFSTLDTDLGESPVLSKRIPKGV